MQSQLKMVYLSYPLSAEEMQAIDLARKNYLAKEIKE